MPACACACVFVCVLVRECVRRCYVCLCMCAYARARACVWAYLLLQYLSSMNMTTNNYIDRKTLTMHRFR